MVGNLPVYFNTNFVKLPLYLRYPGQEIVIYVKTDRYLSFPRAGESLAAEGSLYIKIFPIQALVSCQRVVVLIHYRDLFKSEVFS